MKVEVVVRREGKKWIATINNGWWLSIASTREQAIQSLIDSFQRDTGVILKASGAKQLEFPIDNRNNNMI